jgi:hypothetical protein
VANLALAHQVVEPAEHFRVVIKIGRRAVQLHQVQTIHAQVAQTVLDPGRQILARVALHRLRRQPASGFRRHDDLFLALPLQPGDQPFAAAHPVHVGGVDEIDAAIHGAVQRGQRFRVVHLAPCPADGPRAERDLRYLPARTAQGSIKHLFSVAEAAAKIVL